MLKITMLAVALLALGGCYYEPGYVRSDDAYGDVYYGANDGGGYYGYDGGYAPAYYGPDYGPGYFGYGYDYGIWPAFGLGLYYDDFHRGHYRDGGYGGGWRGGSSWHDGGSHGGSLGGFSHGDRAHFSAPSGGHHR
ncbi:MAG TPA: hypothetical protein VGC30_08695 [Dokdonella sp.]